MTGYGCCIRYRCPIGPATVTSARPEQLQAEAHSRTFRFRDPTNEYSIAPESEGCRGSLTLVLVVKLRVRVRVTYASPLLLPSYRRLLSRLLPRINLKSFPLLEFMKTKSLLSHVFVIARLLDLFLIHYTIQVSLRT